MTQNREPVPTSGEGESSTFRHGTYAGYRIHGCRCYPCAAARSDYDDRRNRLIAYGQWKPFTDAEPVRAHVRSLRAAGLGRRRIARLAGVSPSVLNTLLYGKPGREPSARVRLRTAAALLALEPESAALADHQLVDATGFHRRTRALVAVGFSHAFLARRFGRTLANFLRPTDRVTVLTDRRAREVYEELWNKDPLEYGMTAQAATRARNLAASRGWAPPQAWDDETIDDPKARPRGVRREAA
jgi:transcriptional regulator with XRE-family HTH domain